MNIAAVLSMAGIGFDRDVAEGRRRSALKLNTHYITDRGGPGRSASSSSRCPAPDNPKTALLACDSALAAIKALGSPVRYGT